MKKDFMAVILGNDENAYGFARAFFEKYGIRPVAFATEERTDTKNTSIMDIRIDDRLYKREYLIDVLVDLGNKLKKEYEKIFIVPSSNIFVNLLSNEDSKLSMYENIFLNSKELNSIEGSHKFYELCEQYDLLYPKSVICTPDNYVDVIKRLDFGFPLILKPDNPYSYEYLYSEFDDKKTFYLIIDGEDLEKKINDIYSSSYQGELVLQEYIDGDISNVRVLNVYSDKRSIVRVMSLGQPIMEDSIGNFSSILSVTDVFPFMDDIRHFLETIHYRGASSFILKLDSKTDKYYLLEMKLVAGNGSYYTTPASASIQNAYVDDLVYDNVGEFIKNKNEILWMDTPKRIKKKDIKDPELLKKIERTIKNKKIYYTFSYEIDTSLKRRVTVIERNLRRGYHKKHPSKKSEQL